MNGGAQRLHRQWLALSFHSLSAAFRMSPLPEAPEPPTFRGTYSSVMCPGTRSMSTEATAGHWEARASLPQRGSAFELGCPRLRREDQSISAFQAAFPRPTDCPQQPDEMPLCKSRTLLHSPPAAPGHVASPQRAGLHGITQGCPWHRAKR